MQRVFGHLVFSGVVSYGCFYFPYTQSCDQHIIVDSKLLKFFWQKMQKLYEKYLIINIFNYKCKIHLSIESQYLVINLFFII